MLLYNISFVRKRIGIIVLAVRKKKKNIQKVIFPRIKKYSKYKKDYDILLNHQVYIAKKKVWDIKLFSHVIVGLIWYK